MNKKINIVKFPFKGRRCSSETLGLHPSSGSSERRIGTEIAEPTRIDFGSLEDLRRNERKSGFGTGHHRRNYQANSSRQM